MLLLSLRWSPLTADPFPFPAFIMDPLKIVTVFVSAALIVTGMGTGAIGLGIDSLHTTLVSDTSEFITGPGTALTKVSVQETWKMVVSDVIT